MNWLQTLDVRLFHGVNLSLANSFLDSWMPFFSGNRYFAPAVVLLSALVVWKGGARGRLCVLALILVVFLGDSFVCHPIKDLVHRPRPFLALADARVPEGVGRANTGSMPSSHAANWFAAAMVLLIYYRPTVWFMLPLALIVSFSRVYNGVHFPSDVLAGAVLGAGYAAGGVWTLDAFWQRVGRRWFPLWWRRLPSLLNPAPVPAEPEVGAPNSQLSDQHWLRLGYVLIGVQLLVNLVYIGSGKIGLSEDEAYQWIWSKHLAFSYYSKPPLIAVAQFIGTSLWGDTGFGVRFCAPVIAAVISLEMLRFMARVVNARASFWLSLIIPTVPLFAVGSILLTVDPLSVLFWTLAMVSGWRAIQNHSTTGDWAWVGLWMGLGFLSKYTALFQWLGWAVLFALWPPARQQLRRPGIYLALFVNLLCTAPVLFWNYQHHWITVQHVAEGGHLDQPWALTATNLWIGFSTYTRDFLAAEAGLQNPFYFLPVVWAAGAFWRKQRHDELPVFFFSMGAPLFLCYLLFTLHSRVLPNWIAPSILPLFCLATVYWERRWQAGERTIKLWLAGGLVVGGIAVVLMHDTNLIPKLTGLRLPPAIDQTRRVRAWPETAELVETARRKLLAEGKPVFIIGGHYGITSEITFNLPEAKAHVSSQPLVYFLSSKIPQNQFYFWPGYRDRKGQNAIFVQELDFVAGDIPATPEELTQEFESVTDLGVVVIMDRGEPVRRIQLMECRGLR